MSAMGAKRTFSGAEAIHYPAKEWGELSVERDLLANQPKRQYANHDKQHDPDPIVPLAEIDVVGRNIEPIAPWLLFTDYTAALPSFENAALNVATWIERDRPVRPHRVLAEKLVLNVTPRLGNHCRCRCHVLDSPPLPDGDLLADVRA